MNTEAAAQLIQILEKTVSPGKARRLDAKWRLDVRKRGDTRLDVSEPHDSFTAKNIRIVQG